MLSDKLREIPVDTQGVYCLFDLDGNAAYAGKSSDLRSRLRQHFIRQDSSVASYGRLDIWDISHFHWWEAESYDRAEDFLLDYYSPYLNFKSDLETPNGSSPIGFENPDGVVHLIDEEEREFRSQPYNRTKQKIDHISRMVDKIKLAGHSDNTKRTLYEHQRILRNNIDEFLGVKQPEDQSDLQDYTE
ncbi:GIY-YIG nuclease family protein [Natranaeroarchaeum sulfidigenes]|uniref:GIY-YIG domain-containing protein n=1 Tax=Natranaeroarchaeum sulfidigenes TaxID=2784880 RepID=A0A897MS05_9EURY|nr:GIY-YIG nuclease family protein [Natranaeroarchaeum sulfidigenes]QSG02818.1 hypothetical protein AArcS_1607 [Natranaeroarchaeum sulfidigenes]